MAIISTRYKSTCYYFIETGSGLLAFDAGWPGTYSEYRDGLRAAGYKMKEIRWLIVSHFHMDHAGLAGMLVENGIQFFVFENQLQAIDEMEKLVTGKNLPYQKLDRSRITLCETAGSRSLLQSIGISGEVIRTQGHSEDHVSLVLDTGEALIGDLPPEKMIGDDDQKSRADWKKLRSMGVKRILPAHAGEFLLDTV